MIILVVEDEAVIATSLAVALVHAGHEVLGPAPDEAKALRLAAEGRPDLALVDIRLRDGGCGVRLAREFKARWALACLFASGQAGQARASADAALGSIAKPYDPDEVVEAVAAVGELLAGRQPRRVPPRLELFGGWGDPAPRPVGDGATGLAHARHGRPC